MKRGEVKVDWMYKERMECRGKLRGEKEGIGVARMSVIIRRGNLKHKRTFPFLLEDDLAWILVTKANCCQFSAV